jgi:hypothetical protein
MAIRSGQRQIVFPLAFSPADAYAERGTYLGL